jgi:hypothetical protein
MDDRTEAEVERDIMNLQENISDMVALMTLQELVRLLQLPGFSQLSKEVDARLTAERDKPTN